MIKNKYLFSGVVLAFLFSISFAPSIDSLSPLDDSTTDYFASYPTLIGLDAKIAVLEDRVLVNEMDIEKEYYLQYATELVGAYGSLWDSYDYELEVRDGTLTIVEMLDLALENMDSEQRRFDPSFFNYRMIGERIVIVEAFKATVPAWLW